MLAVRIVEHKIGIEDRRRKPEASQTQSNPVKLGGLKTED
jgi:hypothetical protein